MEKIASFTVDHIRLMPGIYVSRKDRIGTETVTTFDLRITKPNAEPVINTAELHAMEHLGATYLRNNARWKDKIIYFGPMGCRTGFYLLVRNADAGWVIDSVGKAMAFIAAYEGEIPGVSAVECGNYLSHNLALAKADAKRYGEELQGWTADKLQY